MSSAHIGSAQTHIHVHYLGRMHLCVVTGSGHEGHQCIHTREDRRKNYQHIAVVPVPAVVRIFS